MAALNNHPLELLLIHRRFTIFILALIAATLSLVNPAKPAHAYAPNAVINVNSFADNTTADGLCTLREAISYTTISIPNHDCGLPSNLPLTINIPAGKYTLSLGEIYIGSRLYNLNIIGAGRDNTFIQQGATGCTGNKTEGVFIIGANQAAITISEITISNGATQTGGGGGAIQKKVGSANLVLNNAIISKNCAYGAGGAGIYFLGLGNLTIDNSLFISNYAYNSSGGAIYYTSNSNINDFLQITSSHFDHNISTFSGNAGGAIYIADGVSKVFINKSTFTDNSASAAAGKGGAIYLEAGALNLGLSSANRFLNNTAGTTNTGAIGMTAGIVHGANNWWGCNDGANGAGCDTAAASGGTLEISPWVVLKTTANPNPIYISQSTTMTASVLQNSNGDILTADQIAVLSQNTITWRNIEGGFFSSGSTSLQPDGTATNIYRHNSGTCARNAQAQAKMDNIQSSDPTSTISITVTCAEIHCGGIQNYAFPSQSNVNIQIENSGTDLSCLLVKEITGDHPNATGTIGGSGIKTGKYWTITPLQSDQITPAAEDFTVNLTLPHSLTLDSEAQICRYSDTGTTWTCGRSSSTATTVTLNGIHTLSDWAVGYQVGPNQVALFSLQARPWQAFAWFTLAAAAGLVALVLWWRRR